MMRVLSFLYTSSLSAISFNGEPFCIMSASSDEVEFMETEVVPSIGRDSISRLRLNRQRVSAISSQGIYNFSGSNTLRPCSRTSLYVSHICDQYSVIWVFITNGSSKTTILSYEINSKSEPVSPQPAGMTRCGGSFAGIIITESICLTDLCVIPAGGGDTGSQPAGMTRCGGSFAGIIITESICLTDLCV